MATKKDNNNILMYAGIGVLGYFLYKKFAGGEDLQHDQYAAANYATPAQQVIPGMPNTLVLDDADIVVDARQPAAQRVAAIAAGMTNFKGLVDGAMAIITDTGVLNINKGNKKKKRGVKVNKKQAAELMGETTKGVAALKRKAVAIAKKSKPASKTPVKKIKAPAGAIKKAAAKKKPLPKKKPVARKKPVKKKVGEWQIIER